MIETVKQLKKNLSERLQISIDKIALILRDDPAAVHMTAEEFYSHYNPEEIQKGHCNLIGKLEVNGDAVAQFRIREMIGCAGCVILNDVFVLNQFRNRGIGTELFRFTEGFSRYYGYGLVQATDVVNNEYTKRIFIKQHWVKMVEFSNSKTHNTVALWNLRLG